MLWSEINVSFIINYEMKERQIGQHLGASLECYFVGVF